MLIIQRSQIAAFSSPGPLAGCPKRPYIPSCAEHGAGVGRSNTGRLYEAARKGRSGKSVGVVDETATGSANFFGPPHSSVEAVRRGLRLDYDRRDAVSPAATEHRPGRDRHDLGGRPRHLHLLRASRSWREWGDGNRAGARVVRGDLAPRAAARRGCAGAPPPAPLDLTRPGEPDCAPRARRRAYARARHRALPRAVPGPGCPSHRGFRGARRAVGHPGLSAASARRSSWSCISRTYPFSVIPPRRDPRPLSLVWA
jgi:hypothetical protein